MRKSSATVDLTTIVGIESVFGEERTDPWGPRLAGLFADAYVWADRVVYILPRQRNAEPLVPALLRRLIILHGSVVSAHEYTILVVHAYQNRVKRMSLLKELSPSDDICGSPGAIVFTNSGVERDNQDRFRIRQEGTDSWVIGSQASSPTYTRERT